MKMEAINQGGRKKDWWDLDRLLDIYHLEDLMDLHEKWQPWLHEEDKLLNALIDFSIVDLEPNPRCLLGKDWDIIKINMIRQVQRYTREKQKQIKDEPNTPKP